MRFDESNVPIFSMDIYGYDTYPFPYAFRYPKAGENNSKVQLFVYELDNEINKEILIGSENPYYIPRIMYVGEKHGMLVQTLNRHQNHLKLWRVNPLKNTSSLLLEEKDAAYVSIQDNHKFLNDGTFLWLSERDGYYHIYHYDNEGKLIEQLTEGEWEVTAIYGMNEKNKEIYYQSVEFGSTNRVIFSLTLKEKRKRVLAFKSGFNGATFSADKSFFIYSYSDEQTPPKYAVYDSRKGKKIQDLLNNKTFMLTGKLEGMSRAEAKVRIESLGGKVVSSISKNTNYLITGEKPTNSKIDKANSLTVKIINETYETMRR